MTAPTTSVPAEEAELDPRSRTTFRFECLRAVGFGALETAGTSFIMLIAVRFFHASDAMKSLAAVNGQLGLLLSPVLVTFVLMRRWRATAAASTLMLLGGIGFVVAAIPHVSCFVFGSLFGLTCASASVPLITQMYQDNYPTSVRGKLFSRQLFIRIGTAVGFGLSASLLLRVVNGKSVFDAAGSVNIPQYFYQGLMVTFASTLFLAAYTFSKIPSSPLADPGREARNPFYALRFVRDDTTFRNTLLAWMFMGIANLMMQALRVEYLANTARFDVKWNGLPLTPFHIVLLADTIPNMARLLMSPIWGKYFDRLNFFLFRIAINLGFGIAIATFFTGTTRLGLITGAVIWGISLAGGDLCWTLWVTKLAPPHRVAHYMSVHTFFTGLRGIAAPFLAFALARQMTLGWMATLMGVLIMLSCLILVPEMLSKRPLRREIEEQTAD